MIEPPASAEVKARELSLAERAVWLLDQAAPLNGVVVAELAGPAPSEARVRAALSSLQARHPLLRARVEGGARPRFLVGDGVGEVPLRRIARADAGSWLACAEEELNAPFSPEAGPLMRAALVVGDGEHELLLSHHHLVSDAISAVCQIRELLSSLAGEAGPGERLPMRPAMDALLPPETRGLARLRALNGFFWRQAAGSALRRARRLRTDEAAPPSARRTRVLHQRLAVDETAALLNACRREGTSVQAALVAALLLAAATDLASPRPVTVGCFSTISLRDRLSPSVGEEVGLYISQATTFHRVDAARALWELAREVKAQLTLRIAQGEPLVTLPLLGLFIPRGADRAARFARRVDQAAPSALGVTNIGPVRVDERYGALAVRGLHFAIGIALVVPLAVAANTCNGALHCNVMHVEPLLSSARARAIAAELRARLLGAIAAPAQAAATGAAS